MKTDNLITIGEASKLYEVTTNELYQAVTDGLLERVWINAHPHFHPEDVEAWYRATWPTGKCAYGSRGNGARQGNRCHRPQVEHDPWGLHLCEEHTRAAHKLLAHKPTYIAWPQWDKE